MKIRNVLIVLVIIMFSSFIVGGLIFLASYNVGLGPSNKFIVDDSKYLVLSDDLEHIVVDVDSANLYIKETEGSDIYIVLDGYVIGSKDYIPRIIVNESTGVLKISLFNNSNTFDLEQIFYTSNLDLYINIPKIYSSNISIDMKSGNVLSNDLDLSSLDVKSLSGNVLISNSSFDSLSFDISSGDVVLRSLNSFDLKGSTNSGNINFDSLSSNKVIFEANSGNIVGSFIYLNKSLFSKTNSGNNVIDLPDDGIYSFDLAVSSGNVNNGLSLRSYNILGENISLSTSITSHASSGNVVIK